jgi:hypothetical protein
LADDDFKEIDEKKDDKDDKGSKSSSTSKRSDPNSVEVLGGKVKINDIHTLAIAGLGIITAIIGTKIFAPQIIDDIMNIGKKKEEPPKEDVIDPVTAQAPHEIAVGSNQPFYEQQLPAQEVNFEQQGQGQGQTIPQPNEINVDVTESTERAIAPRLKKIKMGMPPQFRFRQFSRIKNEEPKRDYISLEK